MPYATRIHYPFSFYDPFGPLRQVIIVRWRPWEATWLLAHWRPDLTIGCTLQPIFNYSAQRMAKAIVNAGICCFSFLWLVDCCFRLLIPSGEMERKMDNGFLSNAAPREATSWKCTGHVNHVMIFCASKHDWSSPRKLRPKMSVEPSFSRRKKQPQKCAPLVCHAAPTESIGWPTGGPQCTEIKTMIRGYAVNVLKKCWAA